MTGASRGTEPDSGVGQGSKASDPPGHVRDATYSVVINTHVHSVLVRYWVGKDSVMTVTAKYCRKMFRDEITSNES